MVECQTITKRGEYIFWEKGSEFTLCWQLFITHACKCAHTLNRHTQQKANPELATVPFITKEGLISYC